jgi:hypothetical protein
MAARGKVAGQQAGTPAPQSIIILVSKVDLVAPASYL